MSRRRSRSILTVSLFPFLAVLVCAMGALIFLLIATTQMIGDKAPKILEVVEVEPPPAPEVRNPFIDVAGYDPPSLEELDDAPLFVVAEPEVEEPVAEEKIPIPPPPDPNLELSRTIARLKREREQKRRELAEQTAELNSAQRKLASAKKQLEAHQGKLVALKTDHQRVKEQDAAFQAELHQLQLKIDGAKQRVAELKQRHAAAPSKFALIPYDGQRGTTRRPIFIECTSNGIKFWPEGVFLGPSQLEGFTDLDNPVLAGVRALTDYWNDQASSPGADSPGEPYVLLVVRPQGSIAYYLSKKFLSQSGHPYGYELVEEDFAWHIPEADPAAKRVLEQAISSAIRNRGTVVRTYTLGGENSNLSKFPDLDQERAERDLPFTSHNSNASRFAQQFRKHRQKMKQEQKTAEAFGGGSAQPPTANRGEQGRTRPFTESGRSKYAGGDSAGGETPGQSRSRVQRGESGQMFGSGQANPNEKRPPRLSPIPGWPRDGVPRNQGGFAQRPTGQLPGENGGQFGGQENLPRVPLSMGGAGAGQDSKSSDATNRSAEVEDGQNNSNGERPDGEDSSRGKPRPAGIPVLEPVPTEGSERGSRSTANRSRNSSGNRGGSRGTSQQWSATRDANSGGSSSGASAGQTQQPTLPPMILDRTRTTAMQRNQLSKRGWGQSRKRSGIGIERQVTVTITTDRIVTGDLKTAIALGHGESPHQVLRAVLADIDEHANSWGTPPDGFYWVPSVQFRVKSDAASIFKPIETALRTGGLSTEVEYFRKRSNVNSKQGVTQ